MEEQRRFTWIPFYEAVADRLLDFMRDRSELLAKLRSPRMRGVFGDVGYDYPAILDLPTTIDFDPYSAMWLFSREYRPEGQIPLARAFADEFDISAPIPEDFLGIPYLMSRAYAFCYYQDPAKVGPNDVQLLWNLFESGLAMANGGPRDEFCKAFDEAGAVYDLNAGRTFGLYWTRPSFFSPMDSNTVEEIAARKTLSPDLADLVSSFGGRTPSGESYLEYCELVRRDVDSEDYGLDSIPELVFRSYQNHLHDQGERKRNKGSGRAAASREGQPADGNAGSVASPRHWFFAPGPGASRWAESLERGVMGIGYPELGDPGAYASKDQIAERLASMAHDDASHKNDANAVWDFCHTIDIGDVVYAKRGSSEVIGRGVVTSGWRYEEGGGDFSSVRDVDWTHAEAIPFPGLPGKKLTEVPEGDPRIAELEAAFSEIGPCRSEGPSPNPVESYTREDFLDDVYIGTDRAEAEAIYDELRDLVLGKMNVILQGPPGVGKTFAAKRLAYSIMEHSDDSRVEMVQFHPSYSYEDFVQGYRPDADGNGFEIKDGLFVDFCNRARRDADNEYFLIIDEINRGNLSKIFGEAFMLVEADKRGPDHSVKLLYSPDDGEGFDVPRNLHIIGTMNTADRSIAMIDYALRRRFAFFPMGPGFESEGFESYRTDVINNPTFDKFIAALEKVNGEIKKEPSLGEGFEIGHSYLCGFDEQRYFGDEADVDARLREVLRYEIEPLIREYWIDSPDTAKGHISDLWQALGEG